MRRERGRNERSAAKEGSAERAPFIRVGRNSQGTIPYVTETSRSHLVLQAARPVLPSCSPDCTRWGHRQRGGRVQLGSTRTASAATGVQCPFALAGSMPRIAGPQSHFLLRNISVQCEATYPRFAGLSGLGGQRGRAGLPCRSRSASSGQNARHSPRAWNMCRRNFSEPSSGGGLQRSHCCPEQASEPDDADIAM